MATSLHQVNDISSDELYARILQKEEEDKFNEQIRKKSQMRNQLRNLSHLDLTQIQVIQKDEENDIILIDDDEFQSIDTNYKNSNQNQNVPQNQNDTESDELIARRLQEEFDKESARNMHLNLSKNQIQLQNGFDTINRNTNRIPESFETDILFNMARNRSTRPQNTFFYSTDQPNIFHNLRPNSNNDPVHDLTNAFNFLQNRDFMQEFLNEDQPNDVRRNNLSVDNNTNHSENNNLRRTERASNPTNRMNRNPILNFSNRRRQRINPISSLMANQGDFTADDYESLLRLDELNAVKKCLNRQEIESLPTFEFKENQENPQENTCSICFEVYVRREKLTSLTCLHKFHKKCITEWLKQSRQCPLCKKDAINGN